MLREYLLALQATCISSVVMNGYGNTLSHMTVITCVNRHDYDIQWMHVNMKRDRHSYCFALILLWKVFKNLMHIIHAYYGQCVFYRYKVCKLLLNILWLGTLWLLYKYYKKTCSREVRLPPYKEVHKCGPGGERGGRGGEGGGKFQS